MSEQDSKVDSKEQISPKNNQPVQPPINSLSEKQQQDNSQQKKEQAQKLKANTKEDQPSINQQPIAESKEKKQDAEQQQKQKPAQESQKEVSVAIDQSDKKVTEPKIQSQQHSQKNESDQKQQKTQKDEKIEQKEDVPGEKVDQKSQSNKKIDEKHESSSQRVEQQLQKPKENKEEENSPQKMDKQKPSQPPKQEKDDEQERIRQIFKSIDQNNDRSLSEDEIDLLTKKLGMKVSRQDIRKFIKEADTNKNNKIEFEQFFDWYKKDRSETSSQFMSLIALQKRALQKINSFSQASPNKQKVLQRRYSQKNASRTDKMNIHLQCGDGSSNNSIKINFDMGGQKAQQHLTRLKDINLNKEQRKVLLLLQIATPDPQKSKQYIEKTINELKNGDSETNQIIRALNINYTVKDRHLFIQFSSAQLQASLKELVQKLTESSQDKQNQLTIQFSLDFNGKLKDNLQKVFVQWLCQGFTVKLKVQGNESFLSIVKMIMQSQINHSASPWLSILKSSNLSLRLKSPQNVKKFFTKLGILQLSQETPTVKEVLNDIGGFLTGLIKIEDGKFDFVQKILQNASSLSPEKINVSLLVQNMVLNAQFKSDDPEALGEILFKN